MLCTFYIPFLIKEYFDTLEQDNIILYAWCTGSVFLLVRAYVKKEQRLLLETMHSAFKLCQEKALDEMSKSGYSNTQIWLLHHRK